MAFKPQANGEEALSEINVTPLVDVMLVLVIILLVTAPLLTQSVNVDLPKTAETVANISAQPLQLAIDAKAGLTLNKQPVADLTALEGLLQAELQKNKEVGLHLYADKTVVYEKVAQAIAAVQHAGISKIAFVTVEQ